VKLPRNLYHSHFFGARQIAVNHTLETTCRTHQQTLIECLDQAPIGRGFPPANQPDSPEFGQFAAQTRLDLVDSQFRHFRPLPAPKSNRGNRLGLVDRISRTASTCAPKNRVISRVDQLRRLTPEAKTGVAVHHRSGKVAGTLRVPSASIVVFRSAKERPFAERKATLIRPFPNCQRTQSRRQELVPAAKADSGNTEAEATAN
jgi:hypothetical protein